MLLLAAWARGASAARGAARRAACRVPRAGIYALARAGAARADGARADAPWSPARERAHQTRWPLPSAEAAAELGRALARVCAPGDVILLSGEVGMGKSTLARGFLREMSRDERLVVSSPSYLLDITYPDPSGSSLLPGVTVHHMDLWRLPPGQIAALVDVASVFRDDVALVEWPDRLGAAAPDATRCLLVELEQLDRAEPPVARAAERPGDNGEGESEADGEVDGGFGEGEDEPRRATLSAYGRCWAERLARLASEGL
ncbi:hypothetical protein KFE25_001727 [Diacronema lutheri]|uniref:tRNA threonylcarbamoyladenosine biosynthesis protein TsaE n=1 Tax=Diacronema lutheri TaxID=2081491 RepID=A0A8J6C7P0_DIALT|nr:hypothetical protein KFE25_001727 [Diacronema lutheri]